MSTKTVKGTQLPDDFHITADMTTWAMSKVPGLDVVGETEQFTDYHLARGTVFKCWTAAWRTWMRFAYKWMRTPPPKAPGFPKSDNDWIRYGNQTNKPAKLGESMGAYVARLKAEIERGMN